MYVDGCTYIHTYIRASTFMNKKKKEKICAAYPSNV